MSRLLEITVRFLACVIVITVGSYVIVAQKTITGTWRTDGGWSKKLKDKQKKGGLDFEMEDFQKDVHLNFSFRNSKGRSDRHGAGFKYEDLQGLTKEQVRGSGSAVSFKIVREAGTIECTGKFDRGRGSGTFRFSPNREFIEGMKGRGFEFSDNQVFSAATLDITMSLADDLRSTGFQNLDTNDLFKAKIFRIDSAFMTEMASTGFPGLDMEDLVKARIFKIDAGFVRDVVAMGFETKSFGKLVKLRIFKVTPDYLREMQSAGFTSITPEQAVKLRIFKVTPEFVSEMRGEGLGNLTIEQAVKLRIFNVSSDFIRKARAKSNAALTVEDLVKLRIHGKID